MYAHFSLATYTLLCLQLEDFGQSCLVDVYLVISADVIAVIEMDTQEVVFSCWCSSVIGWTNSQAADNNSPTGILRTVQVYANVFSVGIQQLDSS